MTDSAVAEGHVKLRDGKKWKSRWVVLRKPSPVADCLVMVVSKDRGAKEKNSEVLEHICGLETGVVSEGLSYTLTILSLNQIVQLGFDSKEALLAWDLRLRYSLGEVHSFKVTVLPGTKLESGPATLHLCNSLLVLSRDLPPVITGQWNLLDLRRYGPVHNGFVFEGGTRCGYWTGVFFLSCIEGEQISFLFDCIVRGITPSRGPFGLKPLLPEPSVSPASVEKRLNQEAEELEKRLSLLSHSTVTSTTSFSSSTASDDRSISGSSENSETSRSDSSIGSRLTLWAEPVSTITVEPIRTATHEDEKLIISSVNGPRVPSKPASSRRLQEIGRQSSSDSGIATGSHSSYSGSFSSYTGSLDAGSPREEYSALLSLPPPSNPDKHPCTCPVNHTHEYQVPSSLRYLYDAPRSLLEARQQKKAPTTEQTEKNINEQSETSASALFIPETARDMGSQGSSSTDAQSECLICSPHPAASRTLFTTCPICGGLKRDSFLQTGATLLRGLPGGKSDSLLTDTSDVGRIWEQDLHTDFTTLNTSNKESLPFRDCSEINSRLQKSGPESYMNSPSDLLGHYCSGKTDMVTIISSLPNLVVHYSPPENNNTVSVQTGSYVPMYSALVPPYCFESCQPSPAVPFHHTSHSPIYENCLQCKKGQDGCMLPKPVPTVIRGGLIHPAELKISEGQDLSLCSWKLRSEIQRDKEFHPATPTLLPPLLLNNEETSEGDKKQRSNMDRGRMDPAYEIMEGQAADRSTESEKSRYEPMNSCGQQRNIDDTEDCTGLSDRSKGGVTYVNIPISPTSRKQLHYMELELQQHGSTIRGKGTTKYAQIDIMATETAHRVGTHHALSREAGLQKLEQWRKGGTSQ